MSILLEALKKSEAQRRLGATPTLQTPSDGSLPAAARGVRWPAAAMVLVALVAMAWIGREQYRPPPVVPGAAEAVEGTVDRRDAPPGGATGQTDESSTPEGAPSVTPSALISAGAQQRDSAAEVEEKRRLLRETFRNYVPPRRGNQDDGVDAPRTAGPETTVESAAPVRAKSRSSADEVAAKPDVPNGADAATLAVDTAEGVKRAPPELQPAQEETISYWQMPASLRDGMPELHIRVLVYADRPEDRFLLLNDKRLHEGEEVEPGLRLEEIRRDRAIFSYRNYRFHLKG